MITGDTLYISGLTAVIRRWSCILTSKQWKCLPRCSWRCLHWRRRIKIRQKMWWELLLSRVILSKFFILYPPKTKTKEKKNNNTWPMSILASIPALVFIPLRLNSTFSNCLANCRSCGSSARESRLWRGDFLSHWWIIFFLHTPKTSVYSERLSELDHSEITAEASCIQHAALLSMGLLCL